MGFAVSYERVIFFIGIVTVLFVKSYSKVEYQSSDHFTSAAQLGSVVKGETSTKYEATKTIPIQPTVLAPQYSGPVPLPSVYFLPPFSQHIQVKCEPLKRGHFITELVDILSPEIFTQADQFHYLVKKTMKMYPPQLSWVGETVDRHLKFDQLPHCYVPYAKALSSLCRYWSDMDTAKSNIHYIQLQRLTNDADLSFLPSDYSLPPQLRQIFSGEIFSDPTPPLRIFYKLIGMPKNDLSTLRAQLQQFIELTSQIPIIPFRKRYYIWYANAVWKFLQNESAIGDLKRDMAEIQRLANSGQRFSPSTSTE